MKNIHCDYHLEYLNYLTRNPENNSLSYELLIGFMILNIEMTDMNKFHE